MAVGDMVWLDSKHIPLDLPYKLTAHWFAPFEVTEMNGVQVSFDLPETFGKAHIRSIIADLVFSKLAMRVLVQPTNARHHSWDRLV